MHHTCSAIVVVLMLMFGYFEITYKNGTVPYLALQRILPLGPFLCV